MFFKEMEKLFPVNNNKIEKSCVEKHKKTCGNGEREKKIYHSIFITVKND